ncbi:MAG: hypothetical protein NT001_05800, partial [Candidatus Woesearchaeota archaeon]|nr:hypothetical protein [Candidatus Woesearchaeota archaeon]
HGFHILRTMSPSLDVNIGLETQVVGRDAYAYTTVQQCVPFLREMTVAGKPGIYKVEDVLRKR